MDVYLEVTLRKRLHITRARLQAVESMYHGKDVILIAKTFSAMTIPVFLARSFRAMDVGDKVCRVGTCFLAKRRLYVT